MKRDILKREVNISGQLVVLTKIKYPGVNCPDYLVAVYDREGWNFTTRQLLKAESYFETCLEI